ncbi:hypothetical protein Esti_003440 [Eimeria stiedai]
MRATAKVLPALQRGSVSGDTRSVSCSLVLLLPLLLSLLLSPPLLLHVQGETQQQQQRRPLLGDIIYGSWNGLTEPDSSSSSSSSSNAIDTSHLSSGSGSSGSNGSSSSPTSTSGIPPYGSAGASVGDAAAAAAAKAAAAAAAGDVAASTVSREDAASAAAAPPAAAASGPSGAQEAAAAAAADLFPPAATAAAAAAGGDLGVYSSSVLPSVGPRVFRARLFGSMFSYAYYFLDVLRQLLQQLQLLLVEYVSICSSLFERALLRVWWKGCEHCGSHLDDLYDPSRSSTASWVSCQDTTKCFGVCVGKQRLGSPHQAKRCGYTQTYSEGSSISGAYLSDLVAIGATDQRNTPARYDFIGCHVRETSLFITQKASGIFGVSFPKGFRQPTLIDTMFKEGLVRDRIFSICISEDGGLLTVGGFEPGLVDFTTARGGPRASPLPAPSLSTSSSSTTPEAASLIAWTGLTSRAAYRVAIAKMEVDGVVLGEGAAAFGKTLVDSGTTYSYFPPAVFAAWRRVLNAYCTPAFFCQRERDGRPCWRAASETFLRAALPVIRLTFQEGATVSWPPQSYLYRRTGGFWCDGLDDNRMQESVLGLSFFKHKQIIFDRDEDRIGAINANCPNFFIEERPQGPSELDLGKVEKVSLLPEDYVGIGDRAPRKSPQPVAGTFLFVLGVGDAFLEAQRRAREGRLAVWEETGDSSENEGVRKTPAAASRLTPQELAEEEAQCLETPRETMHSPEVESPAKRSPLSASALRPQPAYKPLTKEAEEG